MFQKSKVTILAAIAAAVVGSPAFAQAVDHTGNLFRPIMTATANK
jgi:hypothetical protein